MPRMLLEDVSAIVTGGGLGAECARQIAALGARVVVADVQDERGRAVAADIGGVFVHCDVTQEADTSRAVSTSLRLGPLRALINSAGLGRPGRTGENKEKELASPSDLNVSEFRTTSGCSYDAPR